MSDESYLSDLEALMWTLDADPHLSSSFANVTLLDRPIDPERFIPRMQRAATVVPRLRRRVTAGLAGLVPPRWVDDPDLNVSDHIIIEDLGGTGSIRDVLERAVEISATGFDRDRPLWRFVIFTGLADGSGAMVQKLHHTITDGEGGVRMSVEFVDFERDAPAPPPVATDASIDERSASSTGPGAFGSIAEFTRAPREILKQAVDGATEILGEPSKIGELGSNARETFASLVRQVGIAGEALSPLWLERSLERRLEVLQIPLEDAKKAATTLGGSVNDLFVAGATGGAGTYHRALGRPTEELRMAMPVSTRSDKSMAGNSFTPTRVVVPCGLDPRRRFEDIHQRLSVTKQEKAVNLMGPVAALGNLLPSAVLLRVIRQQVSTVDFTTSNLRGAPFTLYIGGAKVTANHPIGPLAGTAWNLTTMSVDGSLDMGLHIDTRAVEKPELLASSIADSFAELLNLA